MTDLAVILDDLTSWMCSYVVFPSIAARDAVALWVVHSHAIEAADSTPRLYVQSAEKQSGKTRLLEVLELVVRRPLPAANTTTAALFRSIGDGIPPTVLLDEIDTIFGPKAPEGSEDLRGLVNAGHRRGKPMLRCVGPNHDVKEFKTFAPVVLAGIGSGPDTIEDRSIIVRMRRRAGGEKVRPFRIREAEFEAIPLRDHLEGVADLVVRQLDGTYPQLPDWLTDRPADVWEPLIGIADAAGGDWPDRARAAAAALLSERGAEDDSLGVRLLTEIRDAFGDDVSLTTEMLLERLHRMDESPWGDWQINARWLANHLRPFDVRSKNVRLGAIQAKGYDRQAFSDAWSRYLSDPASHPSQASDQQEHENASVPGTDASVPTSQPQPSDLHRDGGTGGTPGWTEEDERPF